MFDSPWLDLAIGIVLVWALLSLSVTLINEIITEALAVRSKQLWKALSQMLDGKVKPTGLFNNTLNMLFWSDRPKRTEPTTAAGPTADQAADPGAGTVTTNLYATKTVQALETRTKDRQKTRIKNLPAAVFTQALFELSSDASPSPADTATQQAIDGVVDPAAKQQLQDAVDETSDPPKIKNYIDSAGLPAPIKAQLQALWDEVSGDVKEFRAQVDRWFDGQMARVSEIYKQQIRVILIPFGIVIAFIGFGLGFRTDAAALYTDLQNDSDYRALVLATAEKTTLDQLAKEGCPNIEAPTGKQAVECQVKAAANAEDILRTKDPKVGTTFEKRMRYLNVFSHGNTWAYWRVILGILITGIAISFGSTFWFDILKRLVGLRSRPS